MNEQEVASIWAQILEKVKPFLKEGYLKPNGKGELPELWPGYIKAARQRERLGPHLVDGDFPEHLFKERAPNQTQKELDWLRANYKQVTLPVFSDLRNTVSRALHSRNWSLEFDDTPASTDVDEFVNGGIKEWGSLSSFVEHAGITTMMHDAMGVLTVLPTSVPAVEREDGTMVVDFDGDIRPDLHYTICEDVWGFEYDRWYLLLREEKSAVMYGNTTKEWGLVLWLVDGEQVYEIRQAGRLTDWTFQIAVLFQHGIGFPPCIHWGGKPMWMRSSFRWESPYIDVQPTLDIALLQEHYLRASEAKCVYPHTVVIGSPCDFVDPKTNGRCGGTGTLEWVDEKIGSTHVKTCPECHGSGMKHRMSPMGQVVVNPSGADMGNDQTRIDATNALAFVSPSVETVRYIWERYREGIKSARSIMHLDAEAPMAGGDAKTATEAGLNAKAKDAFVKPIADRLFVIMDFVIMCIGKMRHGAEWQGYTLRPPSHYDLRTDADLMGEISEAMDKGLPPAITDYLVWQYISSRYATDAEALVAFEAVTKADRLQGMPLQVLQAEVAAGRVQPWEVLLHYSGMSLWERILAETPSLGNAPVEVRIAALLAAAQADAPGAAQAPAMRVLREAIQR